MTAPSRDYMEVQATGQIFQDTAQELELGTVDERMALKETNLILEPYFQNAISFINDESFDIPVADEAVNKIHRGI